MSFLNKMGKIDYDLIRDGKLENLKQKVRTLEKTAKDGFAKSFIKSISEYYVANEDVKDFISVEMANEIHTRVKNIFDYISSMNTDKYWNHSL